jgi:hypothetical protein
MTTHIPRYLLPHTATLSRATGKNEWGKETLSVYTLRYVRFEPFAGRQVNISSDMPAIRARLFVDAENSSCEGHAPVGEYAPSAGDRVVFSGKEYVIHNVGEYYAESELHHLECELV